MSDDVRIKLSGGLMFLAVFHAVVLACVVVSFNHLDPTNQETPDWRLPTADQVSPQPTGHIEKLAQPANVNLHAQTEMKQGDIKQQSPCVDCQPQVVPHRIIHPQVSYPPTIYPETIPPAIVAPSVSYSNAVAPAPAKQYQIALFVDSSQQSQQLLDWFNRDPQLVKLKSQCQFQVYTSSNPIYRTRFAELVPVEQFPVMLFQDATGGHIHAAGKSMIPATAGQMHADMRKSFEIYQSAKKASKTGAVKTRGYSWDDAISPTMHLTSNDCPDGYCPDQPDTSWRPGDRFRPGLFDDVADSSRNAFFWANASELMTIGVIVVLVLLIGSIIMRRGLT